jgi:hypothetical protein
MPAILSGIALAVVLAVLAGMAFNASQEPVYRAQPMESVRVGDPGHNLVGPNWTGNPPREQSTSGNNKTRGQG